MFGDPRMNPKGLEVKKMNEITDVKTGSTLSGKNKNYYKNGNIPWIKTTEIKGNYIYDSEDFKEVKKFCVVKLE